MGDPTRIIMLEALINTIKTDNLMDNVTVNGQYLLEGLKNLQVSDFIIV